MTFNSLRRFALAFVALTAILSGCAVTHQAPQRAVVVTADPSATPDVAGVIAPEIRVVGDPRVYRWREVELGRRWELKTPRLDMEATFLAGSLLLSRTHPCPRGSKESVETLHFVAGDTVGSRRTCEGARVEADIRWFLTREFTDTLHPNLKAAFDATLRKRAEPRTPPPREGQRPGRRIEQRSEAEADQLI